MILFKRKIMIKIVYNIKSWGDGNICINKLNEKLFIYLMNSV